MTATPRRLRELAVWPEGTRWRVKVRPDTDVDLWLSRGPLHDTADHARAYALELERAGVGRFPNNTRKETRMHITVSTRGGATRACDTSDDKIAGAWLLAEIRRLLKADSIKDRQVTVTWRPDAHTAPGSVE